MQNLVWLFYHEDSHGKGLMLAKLSTLDVAVILVILFKFLSIKMV